MFDPYRKWLGIPPKDQPPHHYRLLGLELFESDLDVIEGAVDKQMAFVRQYQSGEHAGQAAKILNELATARLCLLKPTTKAAYDEKLRRQLDALEPSEHDFPDLPFKIDEPVEPRTKRPTKKTSSSKPGTSSQLLWGGGGIGVVLVAILVVFLSTGRSKSVTDKSASGTVTDSASMTSKKDGAETPASKTPDQLVPNSMHWSDTPRVTEPAGPAIDLLKLVDTKRDAVAGECQQTNNALIMGVQSRLYLPVKTPEDYQLTFGIRRIDGPEALAIGFMTAGRQGSIVLDGWNGKFSGLYVDRREPNFNCTTWSGSLFGDGIAQVVLTVHPGHVHATFDGKTIVDWHGEPGRLFAHSVYQMPCRECPFIAVAYSKYVFESARLIPIKPEPARVRLPRVDRDVEILPLVDLDRDMRLGIWGINKGALYSPQGWAKTYLPVIVPEEYTLSGTVELPTNSPDQVLTIGLPIGDSIGQIHLKNDECISLEVIDGRRYNVNESRRSGTYLKPGVPSTFDCTVTKRGIRMELDGRTLIDWRGDPWRLMAQGDWLLADARRLYLGSQTHFKFRDLKLRPPQPPPPLPPVPALAPGKEVDLLAIIDPVRHSINGKWEREGSAIRISDGPGLNRLVIPFDAPAEYKLKMRVAREPGANDNDELDVSLPFANSQADVVIDAGGATVSGLHLDFRNITDNITSYRGRVIPQGPPVDLEFHVRKTGLKVVSNDKAIIDWIGNPERMTWHHDRTVPGPRIAIGSWWQRFRFEKLTIEPLESSSFPPAPPLGTDGKLLPIVNVQRDARCGEWKLDKGVLVCPSTAPAYFRIPAQLPPRYVLSANVERIGGSRDLFLGLVVGGHPCTVSIDSDLLRWAGIDMLDEKRSFDPANPVDRHYATALLPQGQSVQVRCFVLPDTIIVICGDKIVIRWHDDPRRLSPLIDHLPPSYSDADRTHVSLGSWESEFAFRDLELKPMSNDLATSILSTFDGVFPQTSQANVPFTTIPPEWAIR